jgi:hypothetical protein
MEKAHDFYIKRAYDQRLGYNNLLQREKDFKKISNPTQEEQEILSAYQTIINDKLLMYSLDRDINYFNMGILDYVVNDEDVYFVYYYNMAIDPADGEEKELPEFDIIKIAKDVEKESLKFSFSDRPHVLIPASFIVRDTFYDCNLSANAFNILALENSERKVFKFIKEHKLSELTFIIPEGTNSKPLTFKFVTKNEGNINAIKESKLIMGTKKYVSGIAKLTNGEIRKFNPNPNSAENQ